MGAFLLHYMPNKGEKYLFRMEEKDMKNNKVLQFGIALISTVVLGAVAPALTDAPVFGASVVKAEEQQELKFRITYYDSEAGKILGQMTGTIKPGETINIYKYFDGHEITFREDWMPNYVLTWDIVNEYFYRSADGYDDLYINYKKVDPTPNPAPTPDPGQGQDQNPTPNPAPTPDPVPGKQLPETGEKDSAAATLLGLLVAGLARLTLRKKSY